MGVQHYARLREDPVRRKRKDNAAGAGVAA
jgi:hypothetical protein